MTLYADREKPIEQTPITSRAMPSPVRIAVFILELGGRENYSPPQ